MHSLLGFADSALASYLVHVARKAKSPHDIETILQQGDVHPTSIDGQRSFCQALYEKSHGSGNGKGIGAGNSSSRGNAGSRKANPSLTNADWVDKAKDYRLLLLEDDGDDYVDEYGTTMMKEEEEEGRSKSSRKDRRRKEERNNDDGPRGDGATISRADRLKKKKKRLRTYVDDGEDKDDASDEGWGSSGNDGDGVNSTAVRRESTEERRQRRKDKRQRRHDEQGIGGDRNNDDKNNNKNEEKEEESPIPQNKKGMKKEDALTAEERAELDRERDLRERDEFVQRMLERDQKKTTQKVKQEDRGQDDGEPHEETMEALQRRLDLEGRLARGETIVGDDGKELSLERLREESRRTYLKKRQEREVTLLKQSLDDEEELFRNQKLSAAERKRIELGRRIVKMVEKNENKDDREDDGFYRLPDEYDDKDTKSNQDHALLKSRYMEDKREKSEQELWEESQTRKAEITHKKKKPSQEKQYDLVFDDAVDFVMQETTKGYDKRDEKHRVDRAKFIKTEDEEGDVFKPITEHDKILAGRKMLPVYPYREEFLAAVKDHQILVLVGETGSGKTTQVSQETTIDAPLG